MDRFAKMDFLSKTAGQSTLDKMQEEMVMFMSDEYFSAFYEHFCDCYKLCRDEDEIYQFLGERKIRVAQSREKDDNI